jgi:hypothetical protein
MMKEDHELSAKLRDLATDSCVDLFRAYQVSLDRSVAEWSDLHDRMLCGVLGFVGRGVRGTCLLAGTETPIAKSCPRGGRLRDWVGELTNQLGGRVKSQFIARGVEIALATPIVLSGVQLKPLTGDGIRRPIVLQTPSNDDTGHVMVWIEAESDERFALGPEKEVESNDGEILLF